MKPRHLAITMGDPAGIGPEIIVKACRSLGPRIAAGGLRLLVIGSGPALERARAALAPDLSIPDVTDGAGAEWPDLCFLQAGPEAEPIRPGVLSADGGRLAYLAVERGVRLVGTDAWSWDAPFSATKKRIAEGGSPDLIWEGHRAGREIGYSHLEKLHNLEALPPDGFQVVCFPVKVHRGSAGWTRAVAILDD